MESAFVNGIETTMEDIMRRGATFSGNTSDFMSGADSECPDISAGDTSWMMTATGFVLFMTVSESRNKI